ncbi:BTB/POZ domain-containing protein KCTD5-like protein [Aphelenchoides avenae]|nr:BTB/POZ domain-containing protein KCTD5-like protein [Aphelenchus avenae]
MAADNGLIRLNVGGTTTTRTLRKEPDSFLARFCEIDGIEPSIKDESGAFFIDRDPRYFRIILNYLRSDGVHLGENVSLDELLVEADFFCLTGLSKRLECLRSTAATKDDDLATVKTVTVVIHPGEVYRCHPSSPFATDSTPYYTKFLSSDDAILRRIEATEKVAGLPGADCRVYRQPYDSLLVRSKIFSKADICDILGQCGLVLRHVEKGDGKDELLYFSS